jgi:hypothetical protein
VAWAVARGPRFWAVQSWDPSLLFGIHPRHGSSAE